MPYKRGKKYIGQVRRDGKRVEKVFSNKKEAQNWEAEMRQSPEEDWVEQKIDTVCLLDGAQKYLDFAKVKFSTKTYKEKKSIFRRLFKSIDPKLSPFDLKPGAVLDYLQMRKEQESGNAANKDRKNLKAFWVWGSKYLTPKLPLPNPCDVEKMPEIRSPRYVPKEKDYMSVLDSADGQDKVIILFAFATAMRRGEIFKTKIEDLDLEGNRLRVWTKKREDGSLEFDWLPMPEQLKEALCWWLANRPIKDNPYLFYCLEDKPHVGIIYGNPFTERKDFMNNLCEKAKVVPFGFHAIRHLRATVLFHQGKTVATIQRLLRHRNPNTTIKYLHALGLDVMQEELNDLSMNNGTKIVFALNQEGDGEHGQREKAVMGAV